jgi:hypothetical protein
MTQLTCVSLKKMQVFPWFRSSFYVAMTVMSSIKTKKYSNFLDIFHHFYLKRRVGDWTLCLHPQKKKIY